jgi:hypothetical protein
MDRARSAILNMFTFRLARRLGRPHVLNMFKSVLHRLVSHLQASVRAGRLHRWLVVPATVAMLAALMHHDSLLVPPPLAALAMVPPLAALPFVALASLAPTRSLGPTIGAALIQPVGWLAFVWSVVLTIFSGPYGAVAAGATVPLLLPAEGAQRDRRLAFLTMWLGIVGLAAVIPLAWGIGVPPRALATGAALLFAGGAVWMVSALHAGREQRADAGVAPEPLPHAVAH